MLMGLLPVQSIANTLNEWSYGGSHTTGSGMTTKPKADAADALVGLLTLATPGAKAGVNAAVRGAQRLEPAINRAVTATMDRGGFPAMALDAMANRTVSPATVWHGSPRVFEKFDVNAPRTTGGNFNGYGVSVSDHPDVATRYANDFGNGNGMLYKIDEQTKNPLNLSARDFHSLQNLTGMVDHAAKSGTALTESQLASLEVLMKKNGIPWKDGEHPIQAIKNAGHDAIRGEGYPTRSGRAEQETLVLNPDLLTILERNGQPVKQPFVYPQQAALDAAQRNAALPVEQGGLGLRPDNTPMERARALGHDFAQFHETTGAKADEIAANGFDPRRPVAAAADHETPYGVFTKMNGGSIRLAKDNEVQMPLLVRQGNVEMFKDRGVLTSNVGNTNPELKSLWESINADEQARASQIDALGEMLGTRAHPNTSGMSNAELWRKIDGLAEGDPTQYAKAKSLLTDEFKNRGVDTVMLMNDAGSMGRNATTSISLNPANVRSRFAAFDPMRRNENDLLAGALPFTALIDQDNRNYLRGLLNP